MNTAIRTYSHTSWRLIVWAILLLCISMTSGNCQPPKKETMEPIVTDRPDFTEAAVVVPFRWWQIESGFTYTNDHRIYTLGGTETLIRYGIGRRTELRLGLPNYISQRADGMTTRGFGDTYVGAKFQLGPTKNGFDVALIPAVFLPTGHRDFTSHAIDPEIKLVFSKDLSSRWTANGMLYGSLPNSNGRRLATLQTTLSFGYSFSSRWSAFFEYAGTFAQDTLAQHVYHSGIAYLLNNDTQLDIHYGFGLNTAAPTSFVAAGISFRFGPR